MLGGGKVDDNQRKIKSSGKSDLFSFQGILKISVGCKFKSFSHPKNISLYLWYDIHNYTRIHIIIKKWNYLMMYLDLNLNNQEAFFHFYDVIYWTAPHCHSDPQEIISLPSQNCDF